VNLREILLYVRANFALTVFLVAALIACVIVQVTGVAT
jgi:hypothetical protein